MSSNLIDVGSLHFIKEVYETLRRGAFLSADSTDAHRRNIYKHVEENLDEYRIYFEQIGFILEEGNGYFYFSRKDSSQILRNKLNAFGHWIDVLDLLKAWDPTFCPGTEFLPADLERQLSGDLELKEKAPKLYPTASKPRDIVDKLIKELTDQGYIELLNEVDERYKVVAAYQYLEDMVNLLTIETDDQTTE
jgi:hypothetical protein